MSAPTAHEIRVASVKWALEHSHVARHGLRAREFMTRGPDGIGREESKEFLIGIFEQLMFGTQDSDTDDEIYELWHYTADHWDVAGHLALTQAIVLANLYAGKPEECRPLEGSDPTLAKLAAVQVAEARQTDLAALVEELVAPGGDW